MENQLSVSAPTNHNNILNTSGVDAGSLSHTQDLNRYYTLCQTLEIMQTTDPNDNRLLTVFDSLEPDKMSEQLKSTREKVKEVRNGIKNSQEMREHIVIPNDREEVIRLITMQRKLIAALEGEILQNPYSGSCIEQKIEWARTKIYTEILEDRLITTAQTRIQLENKVQTEF